jgi:Cu/Ag efflux pump CusA
LPVSLLTGVAGALARPMILSYAVAVVVSTVVVLTVAPALSLLLLAQGDRTVRRSPVARWVDDKAAAGIAGWGRRPHRAYAAVALLAVVGLVAVVPGVLRTDGLLPALHDRGLLVHVHAASGTSLTEMDRITQTASRELRALPGVRSVGAHVGRAITSDQVVDVNSGEMWVDIAPDADYAATRGAVADVVAGYPGLRTDVTTYATDQVRTARTRPAAPLVVRVYGIDLPELTATAQRVREALSTLPGVRDPKVLAQPQKPSLEVRVDLAAAQRHGLKPGDVRRAAATLLSGLQVGSLYEDQKVFDVVVWGMPAVRHSATSVEGLLIDTPDGGHVRLQDVADVSVRPIVPSIRHEATARSVDVTAGVAGDAAGVAADARRLLQGLAMPMEYHAEVLPAAGPAQELARPLGFAVAALIGMFLLLQAAFSSWRLAVLALGLLPLAGVGALVAAPFVGGVATLAAGLGLLAVLGITARHLVLLVSRYRAAAGGQDVIGVTRDMAGPVLIAGLTTAALLLPTALYGPVAGLEALQPFAVVVLAGLVTSTAVVLLVVPAVFLQWGGSTTDETAVDRPPAPLRHLDPSVPGGGPDEPR